MWDTAGQERFQSLIPSYIKDCGAAIIVFDITSTFPLKQTSHHLTIWENGLTMFAKPEGKKPLL